LINFLRTMPEVDEERIFELLKSCV